MHPKAFKLYLVFLVIVLAVVTHACSVPQSPTMVTAESSTQLPPVESPILSTPTAIVREEFHPATAVSIVSPTPTSTSSLVTVTVVNGDLAIRTGPDISFDAIAKLQNGETVIALARSIIDGWVEIEIPSQIGKTGWVSIMTKYTIVSGNVLDLPRIEVVEWPTGSYLHNCTAHQMMVKPGDKILEPVSASANNRMWFSPGRYSIYDLDVSGQPVVMNLSLLEHREVSVRKDGNGQRWDCP
jgi:hypothetical protein